LPNTKSEETSFAVNPAGTDAHRVPSDLVEHHADAIDLVSLDVDGPVEDNFYHGVPANLGCEVGVSQTASFGIKQM